MSDPRHHLGEWAEAIVAAWLSDAGWRVLARRHRSAGGGEVDIVALDRRETLVAVEVRARSSTRAGAASASVDARRIRRLERTLVAYAASSGMSHGGLRVDLVTVEPVPAGDAAPRRWRLCRLAGIGSWEVSRRRSPSARGSRRCRAG
jgi:putative endonuclease